MNNDTVSSSSENQDESNVRDNDSTLNDDSKEIPYIAADSIEEEKPEENVDTSIAQEDFKVTHDNTNDEDIKGNVALQSSFNEDNSKNIQNIINEGIKNVTLESSFNENNSILNETESSPVDIPSEGISDNLLQNVSEKEVQLNENSAPRYNKRALPRDCKTYMLETFPRNIMIIFNHEFVNGYDRREGTNDDVVSLINTFRKFRFDIELHKDKLRKEVGDLMLEFSGRDFTDYGCIAITILTHGSEKGGLRARDKKYREQQILKLIKGNPTLATKPIIYIIQACRGTKVTAAVDVVTTRKDNVQYTEQYKLPMDADTLVLHSTYAGKFSYRFLSREQKGSWFIQTLCKKIEELADDDDLESIMIEVKREVAINKEEIVKRASSNVVEYNKQMPVTESTLIRKLFLKRSDQPIKDFVYPSTYGNILSSTPEIQIPIHMVASDYNQSCKSCIELALDQFDYVIRSLEYYLAENPKDAKGKRLMVLAKPYNLTTNKEANEAKVEMAKDIRDHIKKYATDFEKYKYFYAWKDVAIEF